MVPQFVVTGFALEYLVSQRDWALLAASTALFPVAAAIAIPNGAVTRPEDDGHATGVPVPAERPVR